MTTDERWLRAKSLKNTANVIYIINLFILISIILMKCSHAKNGQHTIEFVSNATVTGANVNVRERPSILAGILGIAAQSDRIFIIDSLGNPDVVNGKSGYWYKVRLQNSIEGFIWSTKVNRDE